ncbi:hypothetical protein [Corallococcus macrosporus]|uniref:Outer membrane protein beta-barrel domain-containing protein n=1 Tax=Myxococcus fulvus (strain ATCC BAA-855 / HW-1) TaxID=483219 RepID=F8CF16_MYXFH|nr:hypothetical protein [Corallococcus macrosporus]AEI68604.1 hypothetical protein LILAB_33615 [Corallococcus macrosporus]
MAGYGRLKASLLAALLLAARQSRAEAAREGSPWYVPDHAAMQLAGAIGFLSAGPGWSFRDDTVEAAFLLGWAPPALAGEDFLTFTMKGQWRPFRLDAAGWTVRPLTVGAMLSYTVGDDYFAGLPSRYDRGYYWFRTALRPAFLLGASAGRPVEALNLRLVEGYFELVATDYRLVQFVRNPATVNVELFTLALGAKLRF